MISFSTNKEGITMMNLFVKEKEAAPEQIQNLEKPAGARDEIQRILKEDSKDVWMDTPPSLFNLFPPKY
jgi:hypothetical protein